ncbi:MAG: protein kinase [Planctomycetaceae bacterium]
MHNNVTELLDTVLDRQRDAWLAGNRPSIDDLLSGTEFRDDPEIQLDLLYNEIVIKEGLGLESTLQECVERFPHLEEELRLHFDIHHAMKQRALLGTAGDAVRTAMAAETPLPRGDCFPHDDYEKLELLGHGGMATVYRARHRKLNRLVAIKMFESGRILNSREEFRVQTEARAMARLSHANIVRIFEIGECGGVPFLALELADNGTLLKKLQQFQYTPRMAAELIETLANAIQHAHDHQVIHRDLKPANVLFAADGKPMITDFGLAKVLQDRLVSLTDATRTGEAIGTPRYMAPEQADGDQGLICPGTDVYALGSLLYECLTGRAPFMASSVVQTLHQICHDDPLSPRQLQPAVPRDLETICLHCLEKRPNHRYHKAIELAEDLRRFLDGKPVLARPAPLWEIVLKWSRRKPTSAILVFGSLAILLMGTVGFLIASKLRAERVEQLRTQIIQHMEAGRQAIEADDVEMAQTQFENAWMMVQAEPELAAMETSVSGWLDHSHNAGNRYRWSQKTPPPPFEQRRDEALLESLLLPLKPPISGEVARASIASALEFTIPNDARWRSERELLLLQEIALVERLENSAAALKTLEAAESFDTHQFHLRRAELLEQLGRNSEAAKEREQAERLPVNLLNDDFQNGMDELRRQRYSEAEARFEQVLRRHPEHFAARLFQAICFLNLNRPAEAKIGLTACVAQRPLFQWNYFFRGVANARSGNPEAAKQDLLLARDGRDQGWLRDAAETELLLLESLKESAAGPAPEKDQ